MENLRRYGVSPSIVGSLVLLLFEVQVRSGKVEQIRSCASCETRCKDRLFLGICGKKHEKVKEAALIDAVSRRLEVIFGMI
jgi:hypothetical protein